MQLRRRHMEVGEDININEQYRHEELNIFLSNTVN